MATGRIQTAADGITAKQQREILADMVKGGTGEAMGVIREAVVDGKPCYTISERSSNGEKVTYIIDTYEHAEMLLNIGQLEV